MTISYEPRIIVPRSLAGDTYPAHFPCLGQEGYSLALDAGFVRSDGEIALPSQRRSYNNLPTLIDAPFIVGTLQLLQWSWWVNNNVGKWVNFPLAHPFMLLGSKIETVPARILNGQLSKSYQPYGSVRVTLVLQLSPSVFAESGLP